MAELLHFVSGGKERLYILDTADRDEVLAVNLEDGYELSGTYNIDEDVTSLPTDRILDLN